MGEHDTPQDEAHLPEDRVEDLEPDDEESEEVAGGKHIGNVKYNDVG